MSQLLSVKGLEVAYGEVQVLWGIDLSVEEGTITSLIGGNGAGKTTTLKSLAGLKKTKSGEIRLGGKQIDALPSHRIVERGVSLVLEGGRPFPEMTVLENLEMGAYAKSARSNVRDQLEHVFELFPILRERKDQLAGTLSGGERQMLAISRGLMSNPKLLLLDEPSLGLAPKIVEQMFEVVQELNKRGITILLVEQNIQHTLRISHHNYVLETGRIVMEGGAELRDNEHVKKAYLGL